MDALRERAEEVLSAFAQGDEQRAEQAADELVAQSGSTFYTCAARIVQTPRER